MHLYNLHLHLMPDPHVWVRMERLFVVRSVVSHFIFMHSYQIFPFTRCLTWTWWVNPRLTSPRPRPSRGRRRRWRGIRPAWPRGWAGPCWPTTWPGASPHSLPSPTPRGPGWRRETVMTVNCKYTSKKLFGSKLLIKDFPFNTKSVTDNNRLWKWMNISLFRTDTDMVMDEEIDLDALKCYSAPDILICGNCR